jgi:hypothetical protein
MRIEQGGADGEAQDSYIFQSSVYNQGHTYRKSGARVSTYGHSLLREAVWYGMANELWSFRQR